MRRAHHLVSRCACALWTKPRITRSRPVTASCHLVTLATGYICHLVTLTPTLLPSSSLHLPTLSLFLEESPSSPVTNVRRWRLRLQTPATSHYQAPIGGKGALRGGAAVPTRTPPPPSHFCQPTQVLRPSFGRHSIQGKGVPGK